ncbi:MAG: hypothetical protein M1826_005015 [Phylliscum demangeonii]|nr:MAG: hypothetical protein M1826_005015 [Phylliscum demangeonii]
MKFFASSSALVSLCLLFLSAGLAVAAPVVTTVDPNLEADVQPVKSDGSGVIVPY